MTTTNQLSETDFAQQMTIRDLISDLTNEISDIDSEQLRLEAIDYAISQLLALKP